MEAANWAVLAAFDKKKTPQKKGQEKMRKKKKKLKGILSKTL